MGETIPLRFAFYFHCNANSESPTKQCRVRKRNTAPAWLTGLMETGNCLCCCVKRKYCRKQVIKRRGSLKLSLERERERDKLVVAVTLTYRFCIWKDHPLALAILGRRCTAKPLAVQLTRPLLVLFRVRERYIYTPSSSFLPFLPACIP